MADDKLLELLDSSRMATLATIKRDGRPQLSNVLYSYERAGGLARVSLTADRAKTRNLVRDPRATLFVNGKAGWSYVAADADAELGPVCTDPHDAAADDLVELYRTLAGEHKDWEEYRTSLVDEGRQMLTLRITHVYGMVR